MANKLGFEGKMYYNTGSYGSPTWNEIPNLRDLDLSIESDEADMSNRAGGGFEMVMPALHKITVETAMNYDPADADYDVLRPAHLARTIKEYAISDAAIASSGTQYLRLSMYVTKCGITQQLREGMSVPLTFRPGYSSDANPAYVDVA